MDINSPVTVDASQFNRKIQEWMVASGKSAEETLRTQARLLIKQCVKFTPPKSLAQGRNAIKQDLFGGRSMGATGAKQSRGIFFLAEDYMLHNEPSKDGKVRLFVTTTGEVYGTEREFFKPDAGLEDLQAHHHRYRSKATGRTTLAGSWTRNIGRWKFVDRIVVRKAIAMRYFRKIASHVGRLKAGWLPAYLSLGAGSPASWISRHTSGARGIVVNLLSQPNNPNITIGNYAAGAKQLKHIVTEALRARSESIGRDIKLYIRGIKDRTRT